MLSLQKRSRSLTIAAATFIMLALVLSVLLPPAAGQPGEWKPITPTGNNLASISCLSAPAEKCWSVGNAGTIVYWDSVTSLWRPVTSPTANNLHSVYMLADNDGWAVGDADAAGSTILHWDGVSWSRVPVPWVIGNIGNLYSVFFFDATHGYAVGAGGLTTNIVKYLGVWATDATPALGVVLNSVYLTSATDGWAVGNGGNIFQLTAGAWTNPASPTVNNLFSVFMSSASEGWAVGNGDTILHFVSGAWTVIGAITLGVAFNSVWMVNANEGWAVGAGGHIIHYSTPAGWTTLPPATPSPVIVDLSSVHMESASDGFAAGAGGIILRYVGGSWIAMTTPTISDLHSTYFTSPTNGWAVGAATLVPPLVSTIAHWDGASWRIDPSPPVAVDLWSVHFRAPNDGWAVGAGPTAIRWTGTAPWQTVTGGLAPGGILYGVFMVSTNDVWAVGAGPRIDHWTGIWSTVAVPGGIGALRSVWMIDTNADGAAEDGWAVGNQVAGVATIIRWNNPNPAVWNVYAPPVGVGANNLNHVYVLSQTNVWAVGDGGVIIHWDGATWKLVASPTAIQQNAVYMINAAEGWSVGQLNANAPPTTEMLYWDSSSWARKPGPTGFIMYDVFMLSSTDGWAVGELGEILHFGPYPAIALTTITVPVATTTVSMDTTQTHISTVFQTVQQTSTSYVATATATQTTTVMITTTGTYSPPPSPVPGFPIESILVGLLGGLVVLTVLRRQRRT